MMSGFSSRCRSYPMPQFSSTPGRKFSTTTSHNSMSRSHSSTAFRERMFSVTERLPRLISTKLNDANGPRACCLSGSMFDSTLITSAPSSAR